MDGVPLMTPVTVSKSSPVGRDGVMDQESTVPPLEDGVTVCIAIPLVKTNEFGL